MIHFEGALVYTLNEVDVPNVSCTYRSQVYGAQCVHNSVTTGMHSDLISSTYVILGAKVLALASKNQSVPFAPLGLLVVHEPAETNVGQLL